MQSLGDADLLEVTGGLSITAEFGEWCSRNFRFCLEILGSLGY